MFNLTHKVVATGTTPSTHQETLNKSLLLAAKEGDIQAVTTALRNGAQIHAKDTYDQSPLHWAAESGDLTVIEAQADATAIDGDENTPLHYAAQAGQSKVINILIQAGAKVDARNDDNETPLLFAIRCCHPETAQELINTGADITAKWDDGDTPLKWAIQQYLEVVKERIENHNLDPRLEIIQHAYLTCVKILMASGADESIDITIGKTSITLESFKALFNMLQSDKKR